MTTPVKTQRVADSGRRYFTLAEAERALPYVSRVVQDIVATYRKAMAQQQRMEKPTQAEEEDFAAEERIRREYDALVRTLNAYVDELSAVGVELKDYDQGLIDFPAQHDGREVYLCWKAGEDKIAHWHETDAGFGGRKDIALLKKQTQATG
ncbi:MAG: DUF2203 family protein [Phycisphaera sp.]|nr:DUF2203 family protein [Phycisphaera sp.]